MQVVNGVIFASRRPAMSMARAPLRQASQRSKLFFLSNTRARARKQGFVSFQHGIGHAGAALEWHSTSLRPRPATRQFACG
ncbi:protein of unknown function [Cupriavidus taiwanensis]|uniref:Uncharacterized protein n=1 Tax=Cupriavidus taiwanensis TaxID=164546 RepID=A0A375IFW0_9BURK|nr:protein of unknown function [Cupriavidus taiwanensis]